MEIHLFGWLSGNLYLVSGNKVQRRSNEFCQRSRLGRLPVRNFAACDPEGCSQ